MPLSLIHPLGSIWLISVHLVMAAQEHGGKGRDSPRILFSVLHFHHAANHHLSHHPSSIISSNIQTTIWPFIYTTIHSIIFLFIYPPIILHQPDTICPITLYSFMNDLFHNSYNHTTIHIHAHPFSQPSLVHPPIIFPTIHHSSIQPFIIHYPSTHYLSNHPLSIYPSFLSPSIHPFTHQIFYPSSYLSIPRSFIQSLFLLCKCTSDLQSNDLHSKFSSINNLNLKKVLKLSYNAVSSSLNKENKNLSTIMSKKSS